MNILWIIARDFIYCGIAVLFYSLLMAAPKKAILPSVLLASVGYAFYDVFMIGLHQELFGYFIGTLVIAACGEFCARRYKMPSIIFVFPAVVPLVPGIGLYRSMLFLVQNEFNQFLQTGTHTLFIAGTMAVPIALVNILARRVFLK